MQCHRAVAAAFGKCVITVQASGHRKLLQHLIAEEAQPDTFTCTQVADAIHAVSPVTGAHQRQPVMTAAQAVFDGPHAVLIQGLSQGRYTGEVIVGLFAGHQLASFQVSGDLFQHTHVCGHFDIAVGGGHQPQKVVGAGGANPSIHRRVPPVLHIAFHILMAGAQQQMRAHGCRIGMDHRHAVL